MTKILNNWSYNDVTEFLKENGFSYLKPLKGSHQAWSKPGADGEPGPIVEVSIPRNSYPPKTLRSMIWQSRISEEEWIKWARS